MTRFKLTLEYDGGAFVGWQRQENGMSVQQALEEAVFKTCAETVTAHAAGRTDAGVHATGQVVHVDVEKEFTADKLQAALNFHLKPWPVSIIQSEIAPPDFHARFSATGKRYEYLIRNAAVVLPFERAYVWHLAERLDIHPRVIAYAKNHALGFEVPYRSGAEPRRYRPDYIVRLDDGRGGEVNLVLEVKGYRDHDAMLKATTMTTQWIPGVNRLGRFGRWAFAELREIHDFGPALDRAIAEACGETA